MIQDKIAAGPAIFAAEPEPKSHPDPINELRASIIAENKLILCPLFTSLPSLLYKKLNLYLKQLKIILTKKPRADNQP